MKIEAENYVDYIADLLKSGEKAILLYGDSGTGKSTLAREAARALGKQYTQAQCSANTDETSIIGGFVPNVLDNKTEFMFVKKALTTAFENGYICIIDELNLAQPDTLSLLNSMLDDVAILTLDNGEIVQRHPDFQLICTENTGLEGCKYMNAATMNRFYTIKIPGVKLTEIYRRLNDNGIIDSDFIDGEMYGEMIAFFEMLKNESLDVNNIITYRNHEKMFRLLVFLYKQARTNITTLKRFLKDIEQLVDRVFTNTFLDVFIENQFEITDLLAKGDVFSKKKAVVRLISAYFNNQFALKDRVELEIEAEKEKAEKSETKSDKSKTETDEKEKEIEEPEKSEKPSTKKSSAKSESTDANVDDTETDEEDEEEKEPEESVSMKVDLDVVLNEL